MLKFLGWAFSIFLIAAHFAGDNTLEYAMAISALVCFQAADIFGAAAHNVEFSVCRPGERSLNMQGVWRDGDYILVSTIEAEAEGLKKQNGRLRGERIVLAELLRDATAVLRTIDPEDATEGEQLEALIDRAERAYGEILETPNVELRGAERDGEAGMRSVPLERRVGGESQSPQHGEKG